LMAQVWYVPAATAVTVEVMPTTSLGFA
jgi:hypothetical protein